MVNSFITPTTITITITITILIFIICLYQYIKNEEYGKNEANRENFYNENDNTKITPIPKVIYTFWDTEQLPKLVSFCIETWKKHNPDYEIHILNKSNVNHYLPNLDISKLKHTDFPARLADFIRLHLLEKYGGLWIDATMICTESLSWIHKAQEIDGVNNLKEYVGFYRKHNTIIKNKPIVENWFMACSKNSKFIKLWLKEFMRINDYNKISQYVDNVKKLGVNPQKIEDLEYLTMHLSAQVILQKGNYPINNLYLFEAETGPLKYLIKNDWNSHNALTDLCKNSSTITPLIKMTRFERNYLNEHPEFDCIYKIFS